MLQRGNVTRSGGLLQEAESSTTVIRHNEHSDAITLKAVLYSLCLWIWQIYTPIHEGKRKVHSDPFTLP